MVVRPEVPQGDGPAGGCTSARRGPSAFFFSVGNCIANFSKAHVHTLSIPHENFLFSKGYNLRQVVPIFVCVEFRHASTYLAVCTKLNALDPMRPFIGQN